MNLTACSNCGGENPAGSGFCGACGEPLADRRAPTADWGVGRVVAVVGLAVLLVGAGLVGFSRFGRIDDQTAMTGVAQPDEEPVLEPGGATSDDVSPLDAELPELEAFIEPGSALGNSVTADLDGDGQVEVVFEVVEPADGCGGEGGVDGLEYGLGDHHLVVLESDATSGRWERAGEFHHEYVGGLPGGGASLELVDLASGPTLHLHWERSALGGCGNNPWKDMYVLAWDGTNLTPDARLEYSGGSVVRSKSIAVIGFMDGPSDPGCCPTACELIVYGWTADGVGPIRSSDPMPCETARAFADGDEPEPQSLRSSCSPPEPLLDLPAEGLSEVLALNLDLRFGGDHWWLPEGWLGADSTCLFRWSYVTPDGWAAGDTTAAVERALDRAAARSSHTGDADCDRDAEGSEYGLGGPTWTCAWGTDSFALQFDDLDGVHLSQQATS